MATAGERITRIETKVETIGGDVEEIKKDVKALLLREVRREGEVKQIGAQLKRVSIWAGVLVSGAINTAFLWINAILVEK